MKIPKLVCLSGPDGSGKSLQAMLLIKEIHRRGLRCDYRWLRFHHLTALPVLAAMRITKCTKVLTREDGLRTTSTDLSKSPILGALFQASYLIDMAVVTFFKIRIPALFNHIIVCDRYLPDAIVDLAIALGDASFHQEPVGRLMMNVMPRDSVIILLTARAEVLRLRKPELVLDTNLETRIDAYSDLARFHGFPVIDTTSLNIQEVLVRILSILETDCRGKRP